MSDTGSTTTNAGVRFPFINLEKSIGRAQELFNADQRGREMTIKAAFETWGYSEKSSGGFQTVAALKLYGLLKETGGGDLRKLALSEQALRYFRDEREEEKKRIARELALKPKLIAALWQDWHTSPPADTIARSHLKAERGLNDQGARSLLGIYKENLAFAELKASDKVQEEISEAGNQTPEAQPTDNAQKPSTNWIQKVKALEPAKTSLMQGERELLTGMLSKGASFRVIVSGDVGVKEIERLIAKLELDKEILGEPDPDQSE